MPTQTDPLTAERPHGLLPGERAGKSQVALARAAGVGKSQLSKREKSKELPKLESLERVLVALGVGYFEFSERYREEIDGCFTRLTRGMFALHRSR